MTKGRRWKLVDLLITIAVVYAAYRILHLIDGHPPIWAKLLTIVIASFVAAVPTVIREHLEEAHGDRD